MIIRLSQYALLYVAKQPERSSAVSISFRLSLFRSLSETVLGVVALLATALHCFAICLSYSFIVLVIVTIVCINKLIKGLKKYGYLSS